MPLIASGDVTTGLQRAQRMLAVACLVVFAIFLVAQHRLVFPYHDDWGYAVLHYTSQQGGFTAQEFTLSQALHFLRDEYLGWSGRVGAMAMQVGLFKLGVDAVRHFQVLCILSSLALVYALTTNRKRVDARMLVPIVLFLGLPVPVLVSGLYWFAAAAGGIWGVPLLLYAALRVQRAGAVDVLSALLLAAACSFHELMAVTALVFLAIHVVARQCAVRSWRIPFGQIIALMLVGVAFALTVLSPGNFNRKAQTVYP
ncbi:MAG TPA: DUF6056 family protein, partial [Arenimonas sp.]|nr:DUF6056 family protein [Arenimonas sp.]